MLSFTAPMVKVRNGFGIGLQRQPIPCPLRKPSPAAKALAMGYRLLKAVESGEVRDFSELARGWGVSPVRVSLLVNLTFLAPRLQEAILRGDPSYRRVSIRQWRQLARLSDWKAQFQALSQLIREKKAG